MKTSIRRDVPHWEAVTDEHGNRFFIAASPYCHEECSAPFLWRLKQRIRGNRIVWYEAHDSELRPTDDVNYLTLKKAMASVKLDHTKIMNRLLREANEAK